MPLAANFRLLSPNMRLHPDSYNLELDVISGASIRKNQR